MHSKPASFRRGNDRRVPTIFLTSKLAAQEQQLSRSASADAIGLTQGSGARKGREAGNGSACKSSDEMASGGDAAAGRRSLVKSEPGGFAREEVTASQGERADGDGAAGGSCGGSAQCARDRTATEPTASEDEAARRLQQLEISRKIPSFDGGQRHGHVRTDTAEWRSREGDRAIPAPSLDVALVIPEPGAAVAHADNNGDSTPVAKGRQDGLDRLDDDDGREMAPGSIDQIVLKFTTVSEGSETPSFVVKRRGARIGRGADNDISIPNDACMRTNDHAAIVWHGDAFHLEDRGHPYGAAVRIGVGQGLRDWPLPRYAAFSAGNTVFLVSGFDEEGAMLLEVHSGPLKGERRRVSTEGATVGRATENSISIADRELSRRHSKVEWLWENDDSSSGRGAFYLCDVGSTNGTYMQLVGPYAGRRRLCLSDHILVGRTGFSVNRFDWGVHEDRGMRRTMEDKSLVVQDLGVPSLAALGLSPQTFVAVYDGHGGGEASAFLWQHLHVNLAAALDAAAESFAEALQEDERQRAARAAAAEGGEQQQQQPEADETCLAALDVAVRDVVVRCYRKTDDEFLNSAEAPQCGSTATTMLILGRRLYSFNVGDSRTVLCRRGRAHLVSRDHKPALEDEAERIKEAGGLVINKRVMGELAVSRAFGDREFKMGIQAILNESGAGSAGGASDGNSGGGGDSSGGGEDEAGEGDGAEGGDEEADAGVARRSSSSSEDARKDCNGGGAAAGGAGVEGAPATSSEAARAATGAAGDSAGASDSAGARGSSSGGGSGGHTEQTDKPLITAEPEMLCATLCADDDFALLACDGLFDVFSSDEAVEMAREEMLKHGDAQRTCELLTERAITERYTRDNVSTVLVVLNPPASWWREGKPPAPQGTAPLAAVAEANAFPAETM